MNYALITIIVDAVLSILSVALIVISVVVAVRTLKQNERMIEASTRPYVVAKLEPVDFGGELFYLIIKNYGQTAATIDSLKPSVDLELCSYSDAHIPFAGIENCFLAPGQSLSCVIDYPKMLDSGLEEIEFTVNYHSDTNAYGETCPINIRVLGGLLHARPKIKEGGELKSIAQTLRGSAEKML